MGLCTDSVLLLLLWMVALLLFTSKDLRGIVFSARNTESTLTGKEIGLTMLLFVVGEHVDNVQDDEEEGLEVTFVCCCFNVG
ncbi:unnamed protein product [Schistosoma curassoni]|uniref:Secreted protein n=1 Tax=Schistosoma curassoni TaxID=6186 RepID=A0A183JBM3_9TREM|nr:unnamed protein product [Schistosoma curassoni]